ncbi:Short chain dehydrogenase/reductase dpchH (Diterpenoid pyrone biosynthesis cluster protein H) [Durusdinium trenchii]|uniref:Short chain dehydrogenase/reductase dpchH (Diterpenoid pyrone biosynthesis cluster protein H) n=1 Tax=Durusdinium trenchii TaxID=1381693 RepID=A0ABP0SA24_9DINO
MGSAFSAFDPTAVEKSQEIYDEVLEKLPPLSGKCVAITGCTTGLGFYLAELAARKGAAKVLLLNRPSDRASKAEKSISEKAVGSKVLTVPCDLMSFESVRHAAAQVQAELGSQGLDVLALNAGVMALNDIRTSEGYDVQMHTNQLAHVLLLSKLMPQLEACATQKGEARVVFHSSSARDVPYCDLDAKYFQKAEPGTLGGNHTCIMSEASGLCGGPWTRYHMTKLANAAYAMKLHEELQARGSKVKSLAVDPGASVTELQRTSITQGNMSNCLANVMMSGSSAQSAADGSTPLAMACFSPEADSGDFYLPEHGFVGRPIKSISKGVPVVNGKEGRSTSIVNKNLAWEQSHAALGISTMF